jgi:hypothetical protein
MGAVATWDDLLQWLLLNTIAVTLGVAVLVLAVWHEHRMNSDGQRSQYLTDLCGRSGGALVRRQSGTELRTVPVPL